MKVVGVETVVVGTPWRELTFVELLTDDGLRGIGEARMVNKTDTLLACIDELAQPVRGRHGPLRPGAAGLAGPVGRVRPRRRGHPDGPGRASTSPATTSSARPLGVPVWRLLGGRFRDRVPAYANGWYQGDRDPAAVARLAAAVVARGYRALKIDPFGAATAELGQAELGLAVDIVAAVRDAVGPATELMIEMHGRFTAATAVRVARALEPYDPAWIEEPVPPYNPAGLRQVRAGTCAAARHRRAGARPAGVPRAVRGRPGRHRPGRPHPLRRASPGCGSWPAGPTPTTCCWPRTTSAARSAPPPTCTSRWPPATTRSSSTSTTSPTPGSASWSTAPRGSTRPTGASRCRPAPGLGVRLDREAAGRHPRTGVHFNLVREGWERRDARTHGTPPPARTAPA